MAKFKPAGRNKQKAPAPSPTRGLIPCAILVIGGIALFSLFFYGFLRSGVK